MKGRVISWGVVLTVAGGVALTVADGEWAWKGLCGRRGRGQKIVKGGGRALFLRDAVGHSGKREEWGG